VLNPGFCRVRGRAGRIMVPATCHNRKSVHAIPEIISLNCSMVSGRHITPLANFSRNYIASSITPLARVEKELFKEKYA
jgi:hypothetical protein